MPLLAEPPCLSNGVEGPTPNEQSVANRGRAWHPGRPLPGRPHCHSSVITRALPTAQPMRETRPDLPTALIASAADFIERAIGEVETAPRYAVIHFASGVELLLKARLAVEHWVLVFADPGRASRAALAGGDFRSVSPGQAMDRLDDVLDAPLSKSARRAFDALSKRRNRYVHFADPARFVYGPERERLVETVIEEQIRAWYELQRLLARDWADEFAPYRDVVDALGRAMHGQRRFLAHKANQLSEELDAVRSSGGAVYPCDACGYDAVVEEARYGDLAAARCRVCDRETWWLWFDPDETGAVRVGEEGIILPPGQGPALDVAALADHYTPYQRQDERLVEPVTAYCGTCEISGVPTVVPWAAGEAYDSWEPEHGVPAPPLWLCVNCLDTPGTPTRCEWCGERVTGETGDYYTPGCSMCAYHLTREAS